MSKNNMIIVNGKEEETAVEEEDRLSSLPDSLLVNIISLLPLSSAISTAVLSRRWRFLWTQVTSLSITNKPFCNHKHLTKINALISQLTSPTFHSFSLYFKHYPKETQHSSYSLTAHLQSWFLLVCAKKVKEIHVTSKFRWCRQEIVLPSCIFRTLSLVALELVPGFVVQLPPDNATLTINLPNLKKMHLHLPCCDSLLLNKMLKCCPVLEDLCLSLNFGNSFVPVSVDISCQNLKSLDIRYDSTNSPRTVFVVDAPTLEYLTLFGIHPLYLSFVADPSKLVEANLYASRFCQNPVGMWSFFSSTDMKAWMGLIQKLLCIAPVLKYLRVDLSSALSEVGVGEEHRFIQELQDCQRSASHCWIKYNGRHFRISAFYRF